MSTVRPEDRDRNALAALQRALGHSFSDQALLQQALTHRSAGSRNNERLEYLGDALLNFVAASELFHARPQSDEGDLSRLRAALVREESLGEIARRLEIGDSLRMGEGELRSGGFRRGSILADALEALIAAVYLDAGLDEAVAVCRQLLAPALTTLPDAASLKDAKTRLQEWLQARGRRLPDYQVLDESGPPHRRRFRVSCRLDDGVSAEAEGGSRRVAEQRAAESLLGVLEPGDA